MTYIYKHLGRPKHEVISCHASSLLSCSPVLLIPPDLLDNPPKWHILIVGYYVLSSEE
jgi:hypothetical protein